MTNLGTRKIQGVLEEKIISKDDQEHDLSNSCSQANVNMYYGLCSESGVHVSRESAGENAYWDYGLKIWFFQSIEEAEFIADQCDSIYGKKFHVRKLPSKIVDGLLHGNSEQKKAIKLRCSYEIALCEYNEKQKKMDLECYKCNIDRSFFPGEAPDTFSIKDRLAFDYLNKKSEFLQGEKIRLDQLRVRCEKLELEAEKDTTPHGIEIKPGEIHELTNMAEEILEKNNSGIYQRGGQLVRIVAQKTRPNKGKQHQEIKRSDAAIVIVDVDAIHICELLEKSAKWVEYDARIKGLKQKGCPERVAKTLISRKQWNLPVLTGVLQAPTLRADGSILENPGYDEETGLFFHPGNAHFLSNSFSPSKNDAIEALNILLDLLKDFPFENNESKSVAVSGILTGLIRKSIKTAPLHGYTAPKMATGKSLLADVVGLVATGQTNTVIPHAENEAEEKKRLLAVLLEGDPIVCFDNIERPFGSPALCSVLTQEYFKDRLLGTNKNLSVPTNLTFLATGNNLIFIGDTSTRAILCSLDAKCESPEARSFEVDIKNYILEIRGKLVQACLTILRAYHVAGRPKQNILQFGRFEEWSD